MCALVTGVQTCALPIWLRREAPWDAAGFSARVDAIIAATARLPAPCDPSLGGEAIFIVGMPRSGSTLFEQVLAAHPRVEGASELPDQIGRASCRERVCQSE